MKLLITGAGAPLGMHLAAGLREAHELRLTDRVPLDTDLEFIRSDLGHDESTDQLVAGVDAIVHQAHFPAEGDDPTTWLDANTRCTYNLLTAAAEAGVERVIYLSTLDLFLPYDEDMRVSEQWRPRPTCEPDRLGPHLGEFVAREFAHSHALRVLVLRLGHVVTAEEASGREFDPMWIDVRDVVGAIAAAVEQELRPFRIVHLQHQSDRARFGGRPHRHRHHHHHRHSFNYTPQFNFEEHV